MKMRSKSRISIKKKKNYDWVEMLFLLPLFAAIDTRAKLAKDATIIHPPLNTSALEKSFEMFLQLEASLVCSSDSEQEIYDCSDLECGEPECDY